MPAHLVCDLCGDKYEIGWYAPPIKDHETLRDQSEGRSCWACRPDDAAMPMMTMDEYLRRGRPSTGAVPLVIT